MKTLKLIVLLVAVLCSIDVFGQSAAAELHFESAEKAYNAGDYLETLRKLDDTERIAGSMSKTLYLRIVAQDKVLDNWLVDDADERRKTWGSLQENAALYLETMESFGLDDRYREVFALSEKYKDYTEPDYSAHYVRFEEEKKKNYFLTDYKLLDEDRFKSLYPNGVLKYFDIAHMNISIIYDETDQTIWRWGYVNINNSEVTWFEYTKENVVINKEAHDIWLTLLDAYQNPKKMSKKDKSFVENLDYDFLFSIGKNTDGEYVDNVRRIQQLADGIIQEVYRHNGLDHSKQVMLFPNDVWIECFAFSGIPISVATANGKTIGIFGLNDDMNMPDNENKRLQTILAKYVN